MIFQRTGKLPLVQGRIRVDQLRFCFRLPGGSVYQAVVYRAARLRQAVGHHAQSSGGLVPVSRRNGIDVDGGIIQAKSIRPHRLSRPGQNQPGGISGGSVIVEHFALHLYAGGSCLRIGGLHLGLHHQAVVRSSPVNPGTDLLSYIKG